MLFCARFFPIIHSTTIWCRLFFVYTEQQSTEIGHLFFIAYYFHLYFGHEYSGPAAGFLFLISKLFSTVHNNNSDRRRATCRKIIKKCDNFCLVKILKILDSYLAFQLYMFSHSWFYLFSHNLTLAHHSSKYFVAQI